MLQRVRVHTSDLNQGLPTSAAPTWTSFFSGQEVYGALPLLFLKLGL